MKSKKQEVKKKYSPPELEKYIIDDLLKGLDVEGALIVGETCSPPTCA